MSQSELSQATLVLLEEFQRSGLRELHIRRGDFELYVSNDATGAPHVMGTSGRATVSQVVAKSAAEPSPAGRVRDEERSSGKDAKIARELPTNAVIVRAPHLGTFYRAPKPGAHPYVEIGSSVSAGDELCLIEVMKLFTSIKAESNGRVQAILVPDGSMVELDQPLFALVDV